MRKALIGLLWALDAVLALAAIEGATTMLRDPSGAAAGFVNGAQILEQTPFRSFVGPGLVLLIANGLVPLVAIVVSAARPRLTPLMHCGVATILLGWMGVQLVLVGYSSPLQAIFVLYGVIILGGAVALGRLMPERYAQRSEHRAF